ncbi:MAG: LLM class F420-dependent oxidoreductase [Actinobacteria bacterium]|nr:LLM class F420-dependent oxidoreductase [Actinomycetota bacterium]
MKLRIFTEPQQGASYDDLLAVARVAEETGFDAFFRSDHYLRMGPGSPLPGPTDAWITLAGLARDTATIRLGTLVTPVTFRHPGILAITVAQVDAMSNGRVELGLGSGWFEQEHRAYGIPYPVDIRERFDLLEEQLAVVSGLWAAQESFDYSGSHYTLVDSPALPKPVQKPGPPIVMGGHGKTRTPALAARYAAEWNAPFAPFEEYGPNRARVLRACEAIERDPATLVTSAALVVCVGTDDAEIARRAAAIGREVDELKVNGICGTPAEAIERIASWGAEGAERIYLQVLDLADLDHIRLIAEQVMPAVEAL